MPLGTGSLCQCSGGWFGEDIAADGDLELTRLRRYLYNQQCARAELW